MMLDNQKIMAALSKKVTVLPMQMNIRDSNLRILFITGRHFKFAISAATLENGCLQFVPGSHKWGLQEHQRRQQTFGVFFAEYGKREDADQILMEPGDGVFFGPLVLHGSAPNTSDQDRMMNTIAYNVTGNGGGQAREALRGKPLE